MRMSGDKKPRRVLTNILMNALIVPARIAADMCYPNVKSFTVKALVEWIALAEVCAVDIAINGTKRFEGFELVGEFDRADVSGVPYFVAFLEVLEDLFIKVAMCVGE